MATIGEQDDLLDIKQAARFLQVSETSLRRWTNSGQLASLRVGRRRERRFRRSDLVAFLEHHPVRPRPPRAPAMSPGTHLCGLYDTSNGRNVQAAAFIADGLKPDCIVFLVADTVAQSGILEQLEVRLGYSVKGEVDAGRLVLTEYAATLEEQLAYFEARLQDLTRSGAATVWVVGDVSGGRLGKGRTLAEIKRYEDGYHESIVLKYPVVTLCQFDAREHAGSVLLGIFKCHGDNFNYPIDRLLA